MKTKHYIKLLAPISIFGFIFRILEIMFAIEPDTGYFVSESVIPIIFNIYIILSVLFFLSIILVTKTEQKSIKGRFTKFSFKDNAVTMLSAVFLLSSSLQAFVTKYFIDGSLNDISSVFGDISFYTIIAAVASSFFFVQFATSPKIVVKSSFYSLLSLAVPIYFVLRLFAKFTDMANILSHSYGTYTIVFLCFLTLSFINLSKLLAGSLCRKYFMAFFLCSVFMGSVHFAEFVLYFIPGNPYKISVNVLVYLADFFICLMLVTIFLKISKKAKVPAKEKTDDDSAEQIQAEEKVDIDDKTVEITESDNKDIGEKAQ